MRVGVLHPGEMGVTVLESLVENDVSATWLKEGEVKALSREPVQFLGWIH